MKTYDWGELVSPLIEQAEKMSEQRVRFLEEFSLACKTFRKDKLESVRQFMTEDYLRDKFYDYIKSFPEYKVNFVSHGDLYGYRVTFKSLTLTIQTSPTTLVAEANTSLYNPEILENNQEFLAKVIERNLSTRRLVDYLVTQFPNFFYKMETDSKNLYGIVKKFQDRDSNTRAFVSSYLKD